MIFKEYDLITKDDLPAKAFSDLKKFASFEENNIFIDVARGGNALRLKNYVGTITTQGGTIIEILPKIYGSEGSDLETKNILLKMLRTLKKAPFKNLSKASLQITNINIFEIFILMFLDELAELIKKGIKADYLSKEENSSFLKGKIKLKSHLQKNLFNKERFYIEFDEYSSNRVENKLIKTTLKKLYQVSSSLNNKQKLREFIFVFDDVDSSKNINKDFRKCKTDRSMTHYKEILNWCRIFLNNESFCPYKGEKHAHALLFDMNLLFESYVAHYFKKRYKDRKIKMQDKRYKLIEAPKLFQLKPDLVVDDNIVMDTKWKVIDSQKNNLDISQSDLYQMYAYGKKYDSSDVYLIYPKCKSFLSSLQNPYRYDDSLNLHVLCFDCFNLSNNDYSIWFFPKWLYQYSNNLPRGDKVWAPLLDFIHQQSDIYEKLDEISKYITFGLNKILSKKLERNSKFSKNVEEGLKVVVQDNGRIYIYQGSKDISYEFDAQTERNIIYICLVYAIRKTYNIQMPFQYNSIVVLGDIEHTIHDYFNSLIDMI
jgi:5-methylcytosine-specific restriction enzyme subunit McrC